MVSIFSTPGLFTVGDGLYCIFDYYSVVLHYQMSFPHLTESSPLDAAVAGLYCALDYYSVLFYYQIITLLFVGSDVGFLGTVT